MKLYFESVILILCLFLLSCETENSKTYNVVTDSSLTKEEFVDDEEKVSIWQLYSFDEREGKRIFEHYCTICHGSKGEGDGFNSYNLNPKPYSFSDSSYITRLSDTFLNEIIKLGGRSMNKSVLMPAYSNTLSDLEIERVVKYIRTFTNNNEENY